LRFELATANLLPLYAARPSSAHKLKAVFRYMPSSVLTVIVVAAGMLASRTSVLHWQLAFCLLGAAAALKLPNGAVITPSNLFLPFLVVRAWFENVGSSYSRRVPRAGVWLGLAALFGVVTAAFVPRVLEGQLVILTADRAGIEVRPMLYPLHPVSTNFTQSVYAIGGVAGFLAIRALLERPGRMRQFRDAVLLLCLLDCAAGLLNLAEFHLGFPPLLINVRNAYTIFDTYAGPGGLVRIHGTFSEASAFAAFTLPLTVFSFHLWLNHMRSMLSGLLATSLCALLLISTSSTAYAGLGIYALVFAFSQAYRGYARGHVPRLGLIFAGALLAAVFVGALFVLETKLGGRLTDYLSVIVFDKLSSDSGLERSTWNHHAWQNFVETYGVGVGLGTARASSYALVLLSNLGVLGTVCYLLFVVNVLRRPAFDGQLETVVREASGQAMLAGLCAAMVSAAVYDLGIAFYAFAAAASVRSVAAIPVQYANWSTSPRAFDDGVGM
jgi:hypothetical protein